MPLEGHWKRVNTPLRRVGKRERNIAIIGSVITVLAIAVVILATIGDSRPPVKAGCVYAIVPGPTGAQPVQGCGADAQSICDENAGRTDRSAQVILESCRKNGVS
jgi:hypothetical protein